MGHLYQRPVPARLPPALGALVLLLEPRLERREVIEDRGGVHLALAGERLERVGPGLARAQRQHVAELLAGLLVSVDRALVQGALDPGRLAHGAVELELEDPRQ